MMLLATASGEEHGLLRKLGNAVKADQGCQNMTPEQKTEIEKKRKEDNKLVKARFIHRNEENGKLDKPYVRYAGDPIQVWKFLNGYEYEVPKGLVDEVNSTARPKRSKEESDRTPNKDLGMEQIYQFVPVGW